MNGRMIVNVLGWILLFEALFLAVPSVTAVIFGEKEFFSFLITMGICLVLGALLVRRKPRDTSLYAKEGFLIVSLSWIVLSLFGALPFVLAGTIPNYLDALFETVSGFSTTGASVLADVEALPRSMVMWRSFTHWVGGMGVLVFIMAFLPLSGGQNMHIMKAESTGPSVSKLVPRVRTTALILYAIYFSMTLLEFILLLCGGMDVFEALNTAFSTAGTGGFGFRNDSMGSFSPYIQIVVTVFMLLFSVNFNNYYLLLHRRFREIFNTELRVFLVIVIGAVALITFDLCRNTVLFGSVGEALRHASFTVSSLISTTGFSTADFDLWPTFSKIILVTVMFVGACAGSTGGGIKVSRIVILFKGMARELRSLVHPKEVRKVTIDRHPVEHEVVRSVNAYMVCYLLVFVVSLVFISFETFPQDGLVTSFTAVTASLNNIGPGLALVGPTCNFAFFSPFSKLVLIFDMLAGRLELFPMLLLFTPATWKK